MKENYDSIVDVARLRFSVLVCAIQMSNSKKHFRTVISQIWRIMNVISFRTGSDWIISRFRQKLWKYNFQCSVES